MKATSLLLALVASSLSMFACAPAEEGDAEDVGATEDAIVETASCTVEKDGTLYKAEARVSNSSLQVRIDGAEGRKKNNIDVSARYRDGSNALLRMPDKQPTASWVPAPVFVQAGSRFEVKVNFDFSGFDKDCKIQLQN